MDNKRIGIVSPVTAVILAGFDIAGIALGYYAVKRIFENVSFYTVCFLIIDLIVLITAITATLQLSKNGVQFEKNRLTFTGLDENNVFEYEKIKRVETHKNTAASFKKNIVDRYSSVILYLDDNTVATVELGFTTKRKLKQIKDEIKKRTE